MSSLEPPAVTSTTTRRSFLKSSAGVIGTAAVSGLPVARFAHAAGKGVIRIGLIGCGGRGSAAALNALNAGPDVRLVAMCDLFGDWLKAARDRLKKSRPEQVEVKDDHCFDGFDGFKKLIASEVEVVLIAAASHFHPQMLKEAVAAGKHVFCEKPHGIDIPGVEISRAAGEEARRKGLSLVSGLCWRYDPGVRETMKRVRDGAIGEIVAIQENYLSAPYIVRERQPGWSETEYQFRNWYHFNWLSGDQTAQQLIHSLDKASWALGDVPPKRVYGLGGRQTALDPKYGDQFDHQAVIYEYASGARVYGFTRDQTDCYRDTNDYILGTKGRCHLLNYRIEGETNWRWDKPRQNMYDQEHKELFDAIRLGQPINNTNYMCLSSALAIAAQIACYSGQMLTWEDIMKSRRSFALPRYGMDVEPPVKPGPDGRYPAPLQGQAEYDRWLMT